MLETFAIIIAFLITIVVTLLMFRVNVVTMEDDTDQIDYLARHAESRGNPPST